MGNRCTFTVLSTFDDRDRAERAADALQQEGFPAQNIHVEAAAGAPAAAIGERTAASAEREAAVGRGGMAAMERFFERLFGGGEHARHKASYVDAVRGGRSVVAVDSVSETAAERAVTVMQEHGAYDLTERREVAGGGQWSETAAGEQRLPDGTAVRWRAAHVVARDTRPLSELLDERVD